MKDLFFCLVLVLLFLNSRCKKNDTSPTQTNPTTGIIQGKVTDAVTGNGISNAAIQTTPATSAVNTNLSGDYTINDVAVGTYSVSAVKTDYTGNSVNVSIQAGKTATANIQLSNGTSGLSSIKETTS